jgi:hypothetical protein
MLKEIGHVAQSGKVAVGEVRKKQVIKIHAVFLSYLCQEKVMRSQEKVARSLVAKEFGTLGVALRVIKPIILYNLIH